MLEEEPGVREEGITRPLGRGGDGSEVLEAGWGGDLALLAVLVGVGDEFEDAVVVHGHCFGGDDVVAQTVFAARVFDLLHDAEGPGKDVACVVGFGFEVALVVCIGEAA